MNPLMLDRLNKIKGVNISAARSCFVQCHGCYNFFGEDKQLLSAEVILLFLQFLKEELKINKVTLCGGDPLSRPDIISLLEEIKKIGFFVNLDTVGTPLLGDSTTVFYGKEEVKKVEVRKLASLVDLLGIPMDGDSNESFATFRKKRPEIFSEQLAILDLLEANNAQVCINTVAHKQNLGIIENVFQIIKRYNCVKKWQVFQYMPIGPLGFKNRESYFVSDYDFAKLKDHINRTEFANPSHFTIEFKSCSSRKGIYLLVDSDGFAWVPNTSHIKSWDSCLDANSERVIFGNIKALQEHSSIVQKMLDFIECIESEKNSDLLNV